MNSQEEDRELFTVLPVQLKDCLDTLRNKIMQMESFDLLANIAAYNHIHSFNEYSDYRGDRMFVISEVVALIALQNAYIESSTVEFTEFNDYLRNVQELGYKLLSLETFQQFYQNRPINEHSIPGIASKSFRDELTIRNPAIPEHHREISLRLYTPFEKEIREKFGFTIHESVTIRESVIWLINKKFFDARDKARERAIQLAAEVFKYRATGIITAESQLTTESLASLNKLSRKQINFTLLGHCIAELHYNLGRVYSFTASELAENSGLNISTVEAFLRTFSCEFGSTKEMERFVVPTSILKMKPVIAHNQRYLIPSLPLLNWCTEQEVESYFKTVPKLQNKFKTVKHDFLLHAGVEHLTTILKSANSYLNLFYHPDGQASVRYETDAIITYERTMFIVEAKGHRLTKQAKEGKIIRTEKQIGEIVKDAYDQGVRTMDFINCKSKVQFLDHSGRTISFCKHDYDTVILLTLTLEPLGNVTPLIRANDEIGYFKNGIFPWIVSLYDLIIIKDHIELPEMLIHYIKRRKAFLEKEIMSVFEEADLLSYYLGNGLYIDGLYADAVEKSVNMVFMGNETDAINNYYMYKYQRQDPNPPKLKPDLQPIFNTLINSITQTVFSHKSEIILHLLDISPYSREQFVTYLKKVKKMFAKDSLKHDFSILTRIDGQSVGFTFITEQHKKLLDAHLYRFCQYKLSSCNADLWIGLGDTETIENRIHISSLFIGRS